MFAPAIFTAVATILTLAVIARGSVQKPLEDGAFKQSSDERVFLANCYGMPGQGKGYVVSSEMDYYITDAESRTGEQPDATAQISYNTLTSWEGNTISGTFHDGNVFVSNIAAGADKLSNFAYAGSGYNNYGPFNCYKDNGRFLFGWDAGVLLRLL